MILVTGAAGKTGLAVVGALVARGQSVRALVHRQEVFHRLRDMGAREVVVGDMRDPDFMLSAASGTRAIYHICPNISPDEVPIGKTVVGAARQANTALFVFHSVLHPQVDVMPHHWQKLLVERVLIDSGLQFVILQPASYMQNVLAQWDAIITRGIYHVPYGTGTRLGLVDLDDVAAVAARVLTEPGHEGATYELAGPEILNQDDVARLLGEALGRQVAPEVVPPEEWARAARATGLSDYQVDTLQAMHRYYEWGGFWGNPHVLAWLLGRAPTSFAQFAQRIARGQRR
jgi:uncharacterized protein YbjT (DUF2867 family)